MLRRTKEEREARRAEVRAKHERGDLVPLEEFLAARGVSIRWRLRFCDGKDPEWADGDHDTAEAADAEAMIAREFHSRPVEVIGFCRRGTVAKDAATSE